MAAGRMLPLLLVAAALCDIPTAYAHGGSLHEGSPETRGYIRTTMATCGAWGPLNGTNTTAAYEVEGTNNIVLYYYKNCSDSLSHAAVLDLTVADAATGEPLPNVTFRGLPMTGSCASGGGVQYIHNRTDNVSDPMNMGPLMLPTAAGEAGNLTGYCANDFVPRVGSGKDAIQSWVLFDLSGEKPVAAACCDYKLAPGTGPNTDWNARLAAAGEPLECEQEGHSGHSSHNVTATSSNATMDDHSGHAGHSNTTTAGNGVAGMAATALPLAAAAAGAMLLLLA